MMRKMLFVMLALAVLATLAESSKCKRQAKHAKKGHFALECDDKGNFKMAQCDPNTAMCFCVDTKTGKQIGEKKQGSIKCGNQA